MSLDNNLIGALERKDIPNVNERLFGGLREAEDVLFISVIHTIKGIIYRVYQ